jgi:exosortase D (VPLPA-CTERM-specific)
LDRQTTVWSYTVPVLVLLTVGFLLILPTFWGGIADLVLRWDKQEEYSHGYMIPLVTAYLIWQRRGFLQRIEFKPTWWPLGFVVIGVIVAVIGEISALYILIHFSLILIFMCMVWSLVGWKAFQLVLVPLLLLIFAIPLPYFLEAVLTAKLQLISSNLGVAVIRLFGIPMYLEGNVIDLGVYQLQVVEACSGLRYLYPLMGVGFIVAYMYQAQLWKRAVVFLSTIPITIVMNSFRIGVIGVLVDYWGIEMAEGFLHHFEGWIIFIACLAILIAEMWLLNRFSKKRLSLKEIFTLPEPETLEISTVVKQTRSLSAPFFVNVVLVIIALFVVNLVDQRKEVFPDRKSLVTFPIAFDDWRGKQDKLLPSIVGFLNVTDYVLNNYIIGTKPPINLYVAYYKSQRKGLAPHSPRVCIPGGGWSISDLERVKIDLTSGQPIPVNRVVIQNGNQKQLVYYWFKQRGRDMASEYWMKWYLLTDSLSKGRTDGALMRLVTPIASNETETDAQRRLNEFLSVVNPMMNDYVPI